MAMKFGKYELVKQLAIGGMAEVFLAQQSGPAGFTKTLCLKRILPRFANDSTFVEMFLDEARTAAQLSHPNIVQIFELGEIEGSYYIAMEYIRGASIAKITRRLREQQLQVPLHYAAKIIADVCAGLEYAHNFTDAEGRPLHLVHRDISPDNVLVSLAGAVKMIDFGIAKAVTNTSKTQAGAVKGKFSYMSPEQIKGQPLDGRSDLFSLGIVLYELTTGKKPFGEDADLMTVSAIVHDAHTPPATLVEGFPAALATILERSLAKEPKDRFQSALEMQRELEGNIRRSGDFVSDRDVGNYLQRLFSDNVDDIETLRRLGSAIQMKLASAPADSPRQADGPTSAPWPEAETTGVEGRTPARTQAAAPRFQVQEAVPVATDTAPPTDEAAAAPRPARRSRAGLIIGLVALAAAVGGGAYYVATQLQEDSGGSDAGSAAPLAVQSADAGAQAPPIRDAGGPSSGKDVGSGTQVALGARDALVADASAPAPIDARLAVADAQAAKDVESPRADAGTGAPDTAGGAVVAAPDTSVAKDAQAAPDAAVAASDTRVAPDINPTAVDAGTGPTIVKPYQPEILHKVATGAGHSDAPLSPTEIQGLLASSSGILRIRTNSAMTAYVDGARAGVSPLDLKLPAGEHRLELRGGPGVSRYSRHRVDAGKVVVVEEKLVAGLLRLDKLEPGVQVFIDGEVVGTTPLEDQVIWEGQRLVRLKRSDGKTITKTVVVGPATKEHRIEAQW